jgi:hypothetical protein
MTDQLGHFAQVLGGCSELVEQLLLRHRSLIYLMAPKVTWSRSPYVCNASKQTLGETSG